VASAPTHAFAALGIGALFGSRRLSPTLLATGAFCSVLPDADVIGFRFGIRYEVWIWLPVTAIIIASYAWRARAPHSRGPGEAGR
jgi:hypothetical protein